MNWATFKSEVAEALSQFHFDAGIPEALHESLIKGHKIFVAGNGGSASLAEHFVCDLSKIHETEWQEKYPQHKAISLCSNSALITAIANDKSYSEIFRCQLENLGTSGDRLILISSSGNSENIIRAAEYAIQQSMLVIGITGFNGGRLKEIAHYSAHVNCSKYAIIEVIHSLFGHFLSSSIKSFKKA